MRLAALPLIVALLTLGLVGCRVGENVGGIDWLDFDGPHREAVLACVKALQETVEGRQGDFPSAAEYSGLTVEVDELDDVRTAYLISGSLTLEYAASNLDFTWECEALEKWGVLRVTEVRHDPEE